jgi:catechol 2,3-dioxygenase-like lactoylglutathione lyase family enzyme
MTVQRISAITLRVNDMSRTVEFYCEVLGLQLLYGGPASSFSSLGTAGTKDVILNLERGAPHNSWGRLIFHVEDVDKFWRHLKSKGLNPPSPRDAAWGERYFHLNDPEGHELSFAQPMR